jgi:hypothetical protein
MFRQGFSIDNVCTIRRRNIKRRAAAIVGGARGGRRSLAAVSGGFSAFCRRKQRQQGVPLKPYCGVDLGAVHVATSLMARAARWPWRPLSMGQTWGWPNGACSRLALDFGPWCLALPCVLTLQHLGLLFAVVALAFPPAAALLRSLSCFAVYLRVHPGQAGLQSRMVLHSSAFSIHLLRASGVYGM